MASISPLSGPGSTSPNPNMSNATPVTFSIMVFEVPSLVPRHFFKRGDWVISLISSGSIRVWTQLIQHLIENRYMKFRKFAAFFSNLVANLRISFILQKKRSTMFRMAYRFLSWGIGFLALLFDGMTATAPSSAMACLILVLPYALSATMARGGTSQSRKAGISLLS